MRLQERKEIYLIVIFIVICAGFACGLGQFKKTTEMIAMPDGVKLATDVYLPDVGDKWPCILIRSPYHKKNSKGDGEKFAKMGYAVVIQDTRGKFDSEGVFYPFIHEREDGLATIEWIKAQKWYNGKIAGWGGS